MEQNLIYCKMCIRNNLTQCVTEAQPYTWCVTGHTKTTQKYNIDNKTHWLGGKRRANNMNQASAAAHLHYTSHQPLFPSGGREIV